MAAAAPTAEPEHEIEQLRAEMELLQAGDQHNQRRTRGFRRRATDADGCTGLGKQKERQW